jgi:hypothetical protein
VRTVPYSVDAVDTHTPHPRFVSRYVSKSSGAKAFSAHSREVSKTAQRNLQLRYAAPKNALAKQATIAVFQNRGIHRSRERRVWRPFSSISLTHVVCPSPLLILFGPLLFCGCIHSNPILSYGFLAPLESTYETYSTRWSVSILFCHYSLSTLY